MLEMKNITCIESNVYQLLAEIEEFLLYVHVMFSDSKYNISNISCVCLMFFMMMLSLTYLFLPMKLESFFFL